MPDTQSGAAQSLALSRLLQLSSTMLPVGAYSYSQGLEWAIECGDVSDLKSAQIWIADALMLYQANFELPILLRLYRAWQSNDLNVVVEWDAFFQAGRDTAESLAETRQMGYSLRRLLNDLESLPASFITRVNALHEPAFPTLYAGIASEWGISAQPLLQAYAWSWAENQVSAAMKAVPLGQVAGQKILLAIGQQLPAVIMQAMQLADDEVSNFAPGLTIAGCKHETQYSRLFRS